MSSESYNGSVHHIIPRSRIPKHLKKNKHCWITTQKKVKKHRAWHSLFNNRLPCEAIEMIKQDKIKRRYPKKNILSKEERRKIKIKEKAYKILFGGAEQDTAIEIVKKEWSPQNAKRNCFEFEECVQCNNSKKICPLLKL